MKHRLATYLVVFLSLTTIFTSATFYIISPKPVQSYMGFGIYSQQGLQGYVPGNMTITPPQTLNWNLTVANRTGREQFIMVIVRIGNSTTFSPNVTSPATPLPELGRLDRFVGDGETSNINFTWTVESTNQTGDLVFLNLQINGQSLSSAPIGSVLGSNFRLIFELWTFDLSSGSFEYGYPGEFAQIGTWLQVWFSTSA
ncbi:MAG TPA: hypothetical protein VEL52_08440 [Candidatus Bathyarchaeia archaeon]|nr:hypothetical protein [Candidatus Bathyarchaeia archaeon]